MREDIYYWKCDSPISREDKRKLFFKDKYASESFKLLAESCVKLWRSEAPASIAGAGCDGNHFAFEITLKSGEKAFLRGDEGSGDDYMLAETAAMELAAKQGVPCPKTLFSSIGSNSLGVNFQILELVDRKPLDKFHKDGSLDIEAAASQLGAVLRKLHSAKLDGFGFLDTSLLKVKGPAKGLKRSYADYFNTKLDEHLKHLEVRALTSQSESADIRSIFKDCESLLQLERGSLVHRDAALWNVLGTPKSVDSLIDWDDCVSGEPADDIGILLCFYNAPFMRPLLRAYFDGAEPSEAFMRKAWLHLLRNMLWKAKLRESLGYFERGSGFFLNMPGESSSLKDATQARIRAAIGYFKSEGRETNGLL